MPSCLHTIYISLFIFRALHNKNKTWASFYLQHFRGFILAQWSRRLWFTSLHLSTIIALVIKCKIPQIDTRLHLISPDSFTTIALQQHAEMHLSSTINEVLLTFCLLCRWYDVGEAQCLFYELPSNNIKRRGKRVTQQRIYYIKNAFKCQVVAYA